MIVPTAPRTPHRCARNTRCATRVRTDLPTPVTDDTCPCACHGQGYLSRVCDVAGGCGHLHNPPVPDRDAEPVFEGGPILTQTGLCTPCSARVGEALAQFPDDYVELNLLLASGESGIESDVVTGSRELPVPIRLSVEALQAAMVCEARLWAALVAERLGIGWDVRACRPGWVLQRSTNLLANGIGTLLTLDPVPHLAHGEWVTRDGIDGALELLRLHELVRFVAGRTKLVHRLPAPCPRCERMTLVRHNGSDLVKCEACPPSERAWWPEDEYQRLTLILAEDYQGLAEVPDRPRLASGAQGTTGAVHHPATAA